QRQYLCGSRRSHTRHPGLPFQARRRVSNYQPLEIRGGPERHRQSMAGRRPIKPEPETAGLLGRQSAFFLQGHGEHRGIRTRAQSVRSALFRVWNVLRRHFISLFEPDGSADLCSRYPLCAYVGVRGSFPTIGPAFASDASPPLVTKAAPVVWTETASPAVSWTSIYLGLNGGFTF